MCWLSGVSRAGYYRNWKQEQPTEEEMELRDAIQRIAVAHRHYGYRRVTMQLRRQNWVVNHKRVARLMRLDNLLAVRKRAFRPPTTDSNHQMRFYLNLAARLQLSGPDQLWIADITYIRLRSEFVYLAVVLDGWSRKVIGWHLSRSFGEDLSLRALERSLECRRPAAGLVHHSDRGFHYATQAYTDLLSRHGILPSMSRPRNPYDNAKCESFMKTLKAEQISEVRYRTMEELQADISAFIDRYNTRRLHSALNYRTPEEFEAVMARSAHPAAMMEFSEA
jgi:putative transposase